MRRASRFCLSLLALFLINFASGLPCRGANLEELRDIGGPAFNHDGSCVILSRSNGFIQVWEVASGKMVAGDAALNTAAKGDIVSDDGKRFVVGFIGAASRVFDATTGKAVSPPLDLEATNEPVKWAVFSPDGGTVLIVGEKEIGVFAVSTGKRLATIAMEKAEDMQMTAGSAAFAAGGALCFVINAKGEVTRYETKNWKPVGKPIQHPRGDSAMDFFFAVSEDGKWLATYEFPGENGPKANLQIWDVAAEKPLGKPLATMNGFTARFLANNRVLVVPERVGGSAKVNVHELPSMKVAYTLRDHEDIEGPKTAVSPDGKWLLTWAADHQLDLFEVATGKLAGAYSAKSAVLRVYLAPDSSGCHIVFDNSAFGDQEHHDYYVVNLSFPEMKVTQTLRLTEKVNSTGLSPNGKHFLVGQGEGGKERLFLYDAATLKPLK